MERRQVGDADVEPGSDRRHHRRHVVESTRGPPTSRKPLQSSRLAEVTQRIGVLASVRVHERVSPGAGIIVCPTTHSESLPRHVLLR